MIPGATYITLQMYSLLYPAFVMESVLNTISSKHTFCFTNVPGWLKPVHFCGGKIKKFFYLGSALGDLATCFSLVTVNKRITMCLASDSS